MVKVIPRELGLLAEVPVMPLDGQEVAVVTEAQLTGGASEAVSGSCTVSGINCNGECDSTCGERSWYATTEVNGVLTTTRSEEVGVSGATSCLSCSRDKDVDAVITSTTNDRGVEKTAIKREGVVTTTTNHTRAVKPPP